MRNLFRQTKGAVTIFVTLLLIPAILVSGTAVDIARIYTARSILQDANQMAANSVLTQYNALLYDLYGVFGVARDDPILGQLLDDYVRVTVFGEEARDKTLGTLQLFYGSDIQMDDPMFVNGKTLRNEDVLRRQIEEYMKFRGPVIIVREFLDALGSNTIQKDTAVLQDKLQIESEIADLYEKYKELYDAIIAADKCILPIGGISGGSFGAVSSGLRNLLSQFINLKNCYSAWENEEDEDKQADHEAHYEAILVNISHLIVGGPTGNTWSNGRWTRFSTPQPKGLENTIEGAKDQARAFKAKFDAVVAIARDIDARHDEISRKVDELERKLAQNECSEELQNALTERTGTPPMTLIERYRDILKWENIEGMALSYRDGGYRYIDNEVIPMLDGVIYRNKFIGSAVSLTRAEMSTITSNSGFALSGSVSAERSMAARFADFPSDSVSYNMPPGFRKFADYTGDNSAFFEALTAMMNQPQLDPVKLFDGQADEGGADAEGKQENIINALLNIVEEAYVGLTNNPLGAKYISDSETPDPDRLNFLGIIKLIPEAIASPVIKLIQDPLGSLGSAGDYLLLLTYCGSMFSNYTTTRPESVGKTIDQIDEINFPNSITGVPISPEVNYFFQSEWEYLYHGDQDADKNLSAVSRLIFLIRLVCNYITVFSVGTITSIVSGIQAAFAWAPPLGLILGELARAAFVAAESLIDLSALRSGHSLPLIKKVANNEWVCSPEGIIAAITRVTADSVSPGGSSSDGNDEKGLSYSNYLLFLFAAKGIFNPSSEPDAGIELARRTGNLIEWNMINYLNDVGANEEKMSEALADAGRFRLENMCTDFVISSFARMRMLFLSMIFAQNFAGSQGIGMPVTRPIIASDYRGY